MWLVLGDKLWQALYTRIITGCISIISSEDKFLRLNYNKILYEWHKKQKLFKCCLYFFNRTGFIQTQLLIYTFTNLQLHENGWGDGGWEDERLGGCPSLPKVEAWALYMTAPWAQRSGPFLPQLKFNNPGLIGCRWGPLPIPPPMGEMGEDHFNKKVDKIEGGN